jgi:hypothetical protein
MPRNGDGVLDLNAHIHDYPTGSHFSERDFHLALYSFALTWSERLPKTQCDPGHFNLFAGPSKGRIGYYYRMALIRLLIVLILTGNRTGLNAFACSGVIPSTNPRFPSFSLHPAYCTLYSVSITVQLMWPQSFFYQLDPITGSGNNANGITFQINKISI